MLAPLHSLILLAVLVAQPLQEPAGFDHGHSLLDGILKEFVAGDRVDYPGLAKERQRLDDYLESLRTITPETLAGWTSDQRMAFWINAYNGYTLQIVLSEYPITSIKKVGGLFTSVWDIEFIHLEALHPKPKKGKKKKKLSLNHIEHDILRPRFEDARVHAVINCASQSCPLLLNEAYVAERLNEQLDSQVRLWLADEKRNLFKRENNIVFLSKIFDWFKEDFERDAGSVLAWVTKYAPAEQAAWLRTAEKVKVRYLSYSWALNDVDRR